jgi:6-phosphogluconolactonase
MNQNLDQSIYADSDALISATVSEAVDAIQLNLAKKGFCHIALTGGTLGAKFSYAFVERLNTVVDLTGLHIWFSDERFERADSHLRNSLPVRTVLANSSVKVHEVQSTDDGVNVVEAAAAYEAELRDIFMDICVLGLGDDGHVASLFPNLWEPALTSKAIPIQGSPKPPRLRVSFSMKFINQSDQVWIIAIGEAKAKTVTQILDADQSIPASHVMGAQLTRLIVDREALITK